MEMVSFEELASEVLSPKLLDKMQSQVKNAEERYIKSQMAGEQDPFEGKRRQALRTAKQLQNAIFLHIPSFDYRRSKLIFISFQTLSATYSAKEELEFDWVDLNLETIRSALKEYKESQRQKQRARFWAFAISILAIAAVIILITAVGLRNSDFNSANPIPVLGIPWSVLIWSFIGSMTAILYRFNLQSDVELQDPYRWLFTRPVTGIVMGIVLYISLQAGLVAVDAEIETGFGSKSLVWLAAFVGGFSDKLADTILHFLVGRFGGDNIDAPLAPASNVPDFEVELPDLKSTARPPVEDQVEALSQKQIEYSAEPEQMASPNADSQSPQGE
jgi:hypothetical protein